MTQGSFWPLSNAVSHLEASLLNLELQLHASIQFVIGFLMLFGKRTAANELKISLHYYLAYSQWHLVIQRLAQSARERISQEHTITTTIPSRSA